MNGEFTLRQAQGERNAYLALFLPLCALQHIQQLFRHSNFVFQLAKRYHVRVEVLVETDRSGEKFPQLLVSLFGGESFDNAIDLRVCFVLPATLFRNDLQLVRDCPPSLLGGLMPVTFGKLLFGVFH